MTDMKTTIADAEELLKQAATAGTQQAAELRERAAQLLRQAKEAAQDLQDAVVTNGRRAVRATDDFVHVNPWKAIGIAAGIGLIAGLLFNRRQ